jgi:hypothetical protein
LAGPTCRLAALRAQQVLDPTVGVQHRRLGRGAVPECAIDLSERRDEVASPWSGGELSGLELAERVDGQAQVVFFLRFLDFGAEQGL